MKHINKENKKTKSKSSVLHKRKYLLFAIDIACFILVYILFLLLSQFSSSGSRIEYLPTHFLNAAIFLVFIMCARLAFRVYNNVWRYANTKVFLTMMTADVVGGSAALLLTRLLSPSVDAFIGIW